MMVWQYNFKTRFVFSVFAGSWVRMQSCSQYNHNHVNQFLGWLPLQVGVRKASLLDEAVLHWSMGPVQSIFWLAFSAGRFQQGVSF